MLGLHLDIFIKVTGYCISLSFISPQMFDFLSLDLLGPRLFRIYLAVVNPPEEVGS